MADAEIDWVPVATFTAGFEADVAVSRLTAEEIPATVRRPDGVAIFGPAYTGPLPHGYVVLVPSDRADEAREILTLADDEPLDDSTT